MSDTSVSNPVLKMTIWAISIPIFIEFFLTFSVFFTDTFFLSRISDQAAASIGSIIPFFMIFVLVFMMLSQGGGSVAGQFLGAGKKEEANHTYQTSLVINGLAGLAVLLMFLVLSSLIGPWFGMTPTSSHYVHQYMLVIAPALLLIAIKTAYNSVLFSQGKTQWNMYGAFLLNIANIVFNCLFILGAFSFPKLGVPGVALSTVLSQLISLVFLVLVTHKKFQVRYKIMNFFYEFRVFAKPILSIGIPAFIEPVSTEIGMMVLAIFIVHLGEVEMAARTYTMNLLILAMCWSAAVAIGNQVLVAHRVGAGMFDSANSRWKSTVLMAPAVSFFIMSLVVLFRKPLLSIFTEDSVVIHLASIALLYSLIIEPARAIGNVSSYALKGTGDAKFPTMVAIMLTWLVSIPLAYYLVFVAGFGFMGIWAALAVDEALRAFANYCRWLSKRWKKTGVMQRGDFQEGLETSPV